MVSKSFLLLFTITLLAGGVAIQNNVLAEEEAGRVAITFPVPELGNCADKESCKAFCDKQENMEACITFAKAHGLMNSAEAKRADTFRKQLKEGGGPGGCASPESCKAFCSSIANFETCIAFAKKHNIEDEHSKEGERLVNHLKNGGKLPGGCTSEESCRAYCSDPANTDECLAFAKKAGIQELEGGVTVEQAERLHDAMKRGDMPGKCSSRGECEAYCRSEKHTDECEAFAKRMGFTRPAAGESQRGMRSDEMREEFENRGEGARERSPEFPPQVIECLRGQLSSEALMRLGRGDQPSSTTETVIRSCFEKLRDAEQPPRAGASGMGDSDAAVPPQNRANAVCTDRESCKKVCMDPDGQFYADTDCVRFREATNRLDELRNGEVPPDASTLPADNACPDLVTCTARCTNENSPYYLKPECVKYREDNSQGGYLRPRNLFFSSILESIKAALKN